MTLTELTVATILASVVMVGLVGFYMGSQGVWIDSSGQALTQRELTQVSQEITERCRGANHFVLDDFPSDSLQSVTFFIPTSSGTDTIRFWWRADDRRVYSRKNGGISGPVSASEVERFAFRPETDSSYVEFDLRMRSPEGHHVGLTTGFSLPNNPPITP